ncbi:uncharacterized protein (DUF2336 family) [Methylopila capsulata]|uniref:Uncharacterized protein (DUF2336 family) n=1 Tax=Methylopila capsulata TaxID=61654 RepID=A0A9W6IV83_9HYPH|nr:DUF2336 domain-containing protein [Methylopila capsulata]MBM7850617.1 uncharacterized protein (DUF2336 family) [Methylopila capsulata]GLK55910.1 hypothetical protein GCM10008170_19290 [Methylopila capsulata]
MSDDLLPIETLERLSRQEGVDVRPTLVRVLTDLYVQKAHHAPEETARYEELALQLLDVVDAETRTIVARKLAEDDRAPASLIARLLDDAPEVAAPIIARFPRVPRTLLLSLALDGGVLEACAVARRSDVDGDMVRLLAHHPDDLVLETLVANPAATPSDATLAALVARALGAPTLAAALLRREDYDRAALAPLYLMANPEQRVAIRAALSERPSRPPLGVRSLRTSDLVDAAILEAAAQSGSQRLVAEAIADALGLTPAVAAQLTAEPSGEPFVLMLRAVGLDRDAIARALLVAQPEIAQSVPRFFDLVEIADATPRAAAVELVAAITGVESATVAPRHEPMFDPSGTPERAGQIRSAPRLRRPVIARTKESGRSR